MIHENLTLEQRVRVLEIQLNVLSKKIEKDFNEKENDDVSPLVHRVLNVYFTNKYEYKGRTFYRYMVHLEGHKDLYIMDRLDTTTDILEVNDLIHCRIDGDKLREVKILYEPK